MKCPNCAQEIERGETVCPLCGYELPQKKKLNLVRAAVMTVSWILALSLFGFGVYKLYFWIDAYKFDKQYTRGAYTPTVSQITLEDGRPAHAIIYYGNDGDRVFFQDLNISLEFSGGVARLEVADSHWFGSNVEQVESADVSIAATIMYQSGDQRRLPALEFKVDAPASPIEVKSPGQNDLAVNTSIYPLKVQVVPGSKVTVNGNDVTDIVDRAGLLSVNVNVFPIGDNTYTIIVKTPDHKEARQDILIYRAEMEIAVEVASSVPTSSSSNIVTIEGKCDTGATISVDTPIVENSLTQDAATGAFTFVAKLSVIGDNSVRFRATMDGKADSVISLNVNYLPSIDDYSSKAWAMDYDNLRMLFDTWTGRIFKCVGTIVDVVYEEEIQYVIMDVGKNGVEQLLVLQNMSSLGSPTKGGSYTAYADVSGRHMYNAHYYPLLNARYMDITN